MPTTRKPEVIVREIEQTRAELADTIDAITERINPRRAASRGARAVREQVASVRDRVGELGGSDDSAAAESGSDAAHMPGLGSLSGPRPAVLAAAAAIAVVGLLLIRRRH